MTKTTGMIGVAALAFLLAMGGGWLANRPVSPAGESESRAEMTAKNRPASTESAPAKPPAGQLAATPVASRIAGVIARLEALRVKRIEITGRIPRNVDTSPDPKIVDAVFKAMESHESETQAVLAELDSASLPEAVAAALKLEGAARDYLISLLFARWGALDPHRAIAAAKDLPVSLQDTGRGSVARGWARHDPKAALTAAQTLNASDEGARTSFLCAVFTGWLQVDAAAAVRALSDLSFDDQHHAARAFDHLDRIPAQRAAVASEIANLADETLRAEIAEYVIRDWAKFDGPAAAAWFDALPWENPRAGLEAAGELVQEWGRTRDQMAPAMDWIWPKVPAELQPELLELFVADRWAKVDRAAAEAWLAKHGIAPSDVPEWDRHTR